MKISLCGVWEYRCKNKWITMPIPNNWETGGLTNYKGKVLFRKYFSINQLQNKKAYWLKFYGVDYKARVWLNGNYIGKHTGYFQPFEFLISKYIKQGKNKLLVSVDSSPETRTNWTENKHAIKGVFGHHDIRPGGWHPKYGQDHSTGGIWNHVEIEETDCIRIKDVLVAPKLNKNFTRATVFIKIILSSKVIKKRIIIKNPKLWWTCDQGEPNLYKLTIKCGDFSKEVYFGLREVKFDKNKNLYLNGRRIFIRGTNIIPEEYLSKYTQDRIDKDINLIKSANINAVRVHAHITRQEFYDACDQAGILVWQDFPLQWEYTNSAAFIKSAIAQAQDMVYLLYNHPSIFFWSCHNEPIKSKYKLDPLVYKAINELDKTRHIVRYSDFREHPYPGWFTGKLGHFVSLPGKPLITEFGAQGLPPLQTLKKIFTKKDLWPPNWNKWAYRNFAYEQTFNVAGINKGRSINEFIKNSQDYQSSLIKFAVEHYRTAKFKDVTGLFHFMFVDPWPCISYSVLDYFRNPKKGYQTLKEVYQPVLLIFFPERDIFTIGDSIRGMFYLVNDFPRGFKNVSLKMRLGNYRYPIRKINIQPNSSITANKLFYPLQIPKRLKEGRYKLVLELNAAKEKLISINTYDILLKRIPDGLLSYNAVFNWD